MRLAIVVLFLTLASSFGMSKKPTLTVTFLAETNPNDTSSFAMPAKLMYLRRAAHLSTVPVVSHLNLRAIFPFKTADNTWGCVFQFNEQGRIRLETLTASQKGTALVCFVGTKGGQHQVADLLIDRPVVDGRITVPRGLSDLEVAVMKTQFRVLGEESPKERKAREKREKEKSKSRDVTDWTLHRKKGDQAPGPAQPRKRDLPEPDLPREAAPAPDRRKLREMDQPRIGD